MNQQSFLNETGQVLRNKGMEQAIEHAEQETPKWSDLALDKLKTFTGLYPNLEFMTEQFREWAITHGLPKPPHGRAFGGVMSRAARIKMIEKAGMSQVKNPKAHCANANVWRKGNPLL